MFTHELARRLQATPLLDQAVVTANVVHSRGGEYNHTIAKTLYMSDRAVEKHISMIFQKLGLVEEREMNRRITAVLAFLEATGRAR